MASKRINAHPNDQAKAVGTALTELKKFIAEGGIVDQEWVESGGFIPRIEPNGNEGGMYVIRILEATSLPYTRNIEVTMHPYTVGD